MDRARDLDGLRFIAAMIVILRHVGEYPELPEGWGGVIRVSVRWCVPFFFLVSGYFLYTPRIDGPAISLERIGRVARMFGFACLIYLPLMLLKEATPLGTLSPALLFFGTWYHLWFLSALCLALIVITAVAETPGGHRLLDLLAVGILVIFVLVDMAASIDGVYGGAVDLVRQTQGVALVWIGFRLARARPRPGRAALLALIGGGAALTLLDAFALERLGEHMSWRQCSPGAILVAIGLLLLGAKDTLGLPGWIGWMGRKHSIAIYVLHPFFVALAGIMIAKASDGARPSLAIAALALPMTLLAAEGLRRYAPALRAAMDGRPQRREEAGLPAE